MDRPVVSRTCFLGAAMAPYAWRMRAALRFIQEARGEPFFLYFAHTYPHIPLAASARFCGKSPFGLYGDVIEGLDWSVGEVLAALKRFGLGRDTLVLFSSDNGPWYQGSPGAYTPVPPGGRVNLPSPEPELYDLINDPDESYNVAPEHPDVVAEIRRRIERLIARYPEEIRRDWEETRARRVAPTPAGHVPRLAAN